MAEYGEIRTRRHCVFILHAHLVFVTKYRRKVFAGRHLERLEESRRDVCAGFEVQLEEFNGESNHVHLLVSFPEGRPVEAGQLPQGRVLAADAAGVPDLRQHYYRANRLWSASYFAGSVGGAPISVLRQYIEQQDRSA